MLVPLLIEIGVEELPAVPFLQELPHIENKWLEVLESFNLKADFHFYYTPRRFVFWHREFLPKQPDREEEIWGAPKAIVDKNPAIVESFAKKNGVTVEEVTFESKGNKEFLYLKKRIEGQSAEALLADMVNTFLSKLDFGKTMRWGDYDHEFIRPIRWLNVILDNDPIIFETYGCVSASISYGHRVFSEEIDIDTVGTYFCQLDKKGVLLYQEEREKKIVEQIRLIEKKENINVAVDQELLDEVVALTEYPTALIGYFEEEYLALPSEVIITSMKEHQRYFPVFKEGKITNRFIVVSNAYTDDFSKVINGNERVLRARLKDALFFWENDLKSGLSNEGLKSVVYMDELGTMFDKVQREIHIASFLADAYNEDKGKIVRAVNLSKADLLSEMVYEFTELQGVMGGYYADAVGEESRIVTAIKEQYLSEASERFSAIVSLATKLDTLLALFSIGKVPKGNKDPFALRRAAISIIKIVLQLELPFSIKEVLIAIQEHYNAFDCEFLEQFFIERLYQIFEVNPSVINAVLSSGERDILEISKKVNALHEITESESFKEVFTTFKRVANISKDVDIHNDLLVDETLFETKEESLLWEAFLNKKESSDYLDKMDNIFSLKPQIDAFFDNVLVNAQEEKVRTNRKNLIASLYKELYNVADIKEISL